jgi:hypothetical protein
MPATEASTLCDLTQASAQVRRVEQRTEARRKDQIVLLPVHAERDSLGVLSRTVLA